MKRLLFFSILSIFSFFNAQAQWTTDTEVNTQVATASSLGLDMKTVGTSTGETFVVFWEPVQTSTNYELRVQLLDVDGNRQFGENGLLVSDQIPMGTYTVMWSLALDDSDNLYIGVTGTGSGNPAYVFKMDTDGNLLLGGDGINIGNGNLVRVTPYSSGGFYVTWLDNTAYQAAVMKYDNQGNAQWDTPVLVENGTDATSPAHLFALSDGGFMEVFHVLSYGINSTLYAQRYDASGNTVWDAPIQLSDNTTHFNSTYDHVQIGDTVYYGYSGATGMRFDSYLQRINPDGTLPWGINGVDFDTNQTNYELYTKIAHQPDSKYIWAICTYTDQSQGEAGEYVQKFNRITGDRLLTDNAKEVFAVGSSKTHQGSLQLTDGGLPMFLIGSTTSGGGIPTNLSLVLLDASGNFVLPDQVAPMATYTAEKGRVDLTGMVNSQCVAVFTDLKAEDDNPTIYAQNYVANVVPACDPPTGLTVENLTDTTVELSWTPGSNENDWIVLYGPAGFDPSTEGSGVVVSGEPTTTLIALEIGTDYDIYVRAMCDEDVFSDWAGPLSITTLGIDNQVFQNFGYYPNPVGNQLNLTSGMPIDNIEIYNLLGQKIVQISPNLLEINFNTQDWSTGVYLMKVIIAGQEKTFRLIKI